MNFPLSRSINDHVGKTPATSTEPSFTMNEETSPTRRAAGSKTEKPTTAIQRATPRHPPSCDVQIRTKRSQNLHKNKKVSSARSSYNIKHHPWNHKKTPRKRDGLMKKLVEELYTTEQECFGELESLDVLLECCLDETKVFEGLASKTNPSYRRDFYCTLFTIFVHYIFDIILYTHLLFQNKHLCTACSIQLFSIRIIIMILDRTSCVYNNNNDDSEDNARTDQTLLIAIQSPS